MDDLHQLYILGVIANNPGLYLHEITSRIKEATNVNESTVCRLLRRNRCTRKRLFRLVNKGAVSIELDSWLTFWPTRDMFVSIDEKDQIGENICVDLDMLSVEELQCMIAS